MSSSGSWASASALPLLQRVATAAFFIAFLAWLDVLPIPWFEREADGVVSFNYHPLCMTLAFVALMPEAVIAYADGEERRGMSHADAKRVHTALHVVATTLLVMGLMAIFANHRGHDIPPLYSAHSWMGVITTALVCCQAFLGVTVFFFNPMRAFLNLLGLAGDSSPPFGDVGGDGGVAAARARLAPYHRFFGAAAFLTGTFTCASGLVEKQAFLKCPIDPTYKFCAVLALPNAMVVLLLVVAACAFGATYARRRDKRGDASRRRPLEDGGFSSPHGPTESDALEDARSALMSARRRTRGNDEYPGYDDSLEY
jgi:cytochrome b-561